MFARKPNACITCDETNHPHGWVISQNDGSFRVAWASNQLRAISILVSYALSRLRMRVQFASGKRGQVRMANPKIKL